MCEVVPLGKDKAGIPTVDHPSGQSLAEHIRELAGDNGQAYVAVLHRLATGRHTNTRARLTAIGLLLDRGYGKPPQPVEIDARVAGPLTAAMCQQMSDEDLAALSELGQTFKTIVEKYSPAK